MKQKKSVLMIHTLPGPYRNPLLSKLVNDKEFNITLYFMAKTAPNRVWKNDSLGFKHTFLPSYTINLRQGDDIIPVWNNPTVPWIIFHGKYDVVLCSGWDSITTFLSRITCWLMGIPMIVWAGSTVYEKSWRRTVMSLPVRALVRSCTAMIAYGSASKDYLVSLGAKAEKVFISFNSVDIHMFRKASQISPNELKKLKKKLGIKNKYVILFVGQFISRKGVMDLYTVVKNISKDIDVGILWVGYGPLQKKLEDQAAKDSLSNQYFTTTHTADETAHMYALADIFVMPTYEDIYSNVVAEALASGLPVITTEENGAQVDYVKPNKNGFVFKAGDTDTLEQLVRKVLSDSKLRKKLSQNTWDLIKRFNYNENVIVFKKAISYALKAK